MSITIGQLRELVTKADGDGGYLSELLENKERDIAQLALDLAKENEELKKKI